MNERPQPLVAVFGCHRRNRKKKPSCPLLNRVCGGRRRGPARGPVARLLPCLVLACPPVDGGPSVAVLGVYVCHQIERPARGRAVAGGPARGQGAYLVARGRAVPGAGVPAPWPVGCAVGRVPTWWPCACP